MRKLLKCQRYGTTESSGPRLNHKPRTSTKNPKKKEKKIANQQTQSKKKKVEQETDGG
jgi:hypothetical protein